MQTRIIKKIVDSLKSVSKEHLSSDDLRLSPVADYCSTIAFKRAKKTHKSPADEAEKIAAKLSEYAIPGVKRVEALNGYVNFFLDIAGLTSQSLNEINKLGADYGKGENKDEKIVLEHSSINPSGPVHVGRLRNTLIGDSIARILRFSGYDVETHYYVNDVGKQVALIALAQKEGLYPDNKVKKRYESYANRGDFQVFFVYVAANRLFESDEGFRNRVQSLIQKAESGEKKSLKLIKSAASQCLEGQNILFNRLSIQFDVFDYESALIEDGSVDKALDFLSKSKLYRESDVGFGVDLSGYGIKRREGPSVLKRKDGTSVYLARDVAYHLQKIKLGDRLINVLGEDHKLEFRELNLILKHIYGLDCMLDVVHFSFVEFEGMQLSTRGGKTAPVDYLLDDAIKKAEDEIKTRGVGSVDDAPLIGVGALKYHILKTTPTKPIKFSWDDALDFEGDSCPYIQYAHARADSIIKKWGGDLSDLTLGSSDSLDDVEHKMIFMLMRYPSVVEEAALNLKPHLIANYVYELASIFSSFYRKCPVLESKEELMHRRLLLVGAVRSVLASGLSLLGVEAPQRM